MKLGYQTNTWGGVVGHPAGVTSVKDIYYLANGSTEDALKDIATAGYKGFEIFDGNLMQYKDKKEEFPKLLADLSLTLIGVYTGGNFIFPDILEEELAKIETVAALASRLGAKHLVVGGGAVRKNGILESDYKYLGDSLNKVVQIAEKYALIPSYHPHLGTCVQSPEQLDKLIPLTEIYLCPDTTHIEAGGGDPVEVIKKYANRIKYVHLKDYQDGEFLPLGEGHQAFDVPKGTVDVDDEITTLVKFENGAIGSIEATLNAWGRNNFLTFEIHGEKGSICFNYERRDELQVCFSDDSGDAKGFRTVYTGPAHPYGEGLWPIPALGIGYGETKIIEAYDFLKSIIEDTEVSPNFDDGYQISVISDAILESAEKGQWVSLEKTAVKVN